MAKKPNSSKSEEIAVAVYQQFIVKYGVTFPRAPAVWAAPEPTQPVKGISMGLEQYTAKTLHYKKAKKLHDEFNWEKYYLMQWLSGTIAKDNKGVHKQEYLGAFTEQVGRSLLAALLRSETPIPKEIRLELASLMDDKPGVTQQSEREFKIQFRKKGRRPNLIRDMQVSEEIAEALNAGQLQKNAVSEVMAKHKISRSEVQRIWTKYRDVFIRLGWLTNASSTRSKLKTK